jgi:DNA mismatch repair ATPase MutS
VPAASAVVGLMDGLYSCLLTTESVTSDMSAFCQDASRIAFMQRHATQRSLCLIDEFGKGTASDDGVALLTATLRHWERGNACPNVVISTHLHEIFTYNLLSASDCIRSFSMNFIDDYDSSKGPPSPPSSPASSYTLATHHAPSSIPSIIPLFSLVPGICSDSYALSCAQIAGLSPPILYRAASLSSSFLQSRRVSAWRTVMEEGESQEAEGWRRVWREFERMVRAGLETVTDEEVVGLVRMMEAEDTAAEAEREERVKQEEQRLRRSVSASRRGTCTRADSDDDMRED